MNLIHLKTKMHTLNASVPVASDSHSSNHTGTRVRKWKSSAHGRLIATVASLALLVACGQENPAKLLEQASTAMSKQDIKTAEIHLKNLLQQQPENGEARLLLARVHIANRDERSAEKEWRRAIESGISPDRALPGLMESLLNVGESKEALEAAAKYSVSQADAKAAVAYWSGRAHAAGRDAAKAEQSYRAALAAKPDYPPAEFALLLLTAGKGDLASAKVAVDKLLAKSPNYADALIFKSDLLLGSGDRAGAKELLQKAIQADAEALAARMKLIALMVDEKEFASAEAQYAELNKVAPNLPVTLYMRAMLDFRQNKVEAASTGVQQALRASPDYLPAVALAATVAISQNSLEQAEQYAKQLAARSPDSLVGLRLLAAVHLKRGDYDKALQTAKRVLDRGVDDAPLLSIAGEASLRRNDIPAATDYLARAAKLDPKDANKRTALGIAGLAGGNSQMGFTELQSAVDLDPDSIQADLALVTERMRARQYDQALVAVEGLAKKQPGKPLPHNLRGAIQLAKGDKTAAIASFEKALSIDPKFFPAAANLAQLDLADKKPDIARKRFDDLLAKDPKNIQAMVALARLTERTGGNDEEVTKILKRAQEIDPSAVEPVVALAQNLYRTGKSAEAIPLLQQAVASHPDNVQLLDSLGTLFMRAGQKQQAIDTFEKIVRLYPNSAPLHLRLGEIKTSLGDTNGAMVSFKQAAELDRKAAGPQFGIAALLLKEGKRDEAFKIAKTFQQQMPNSPAGLAMEGDLLAGEKNWPGAAAVYRKALAIEAAPMTVAKLHEVLKQAGKPQEAEAALREALKASPNEPTLRGFAGEQAIAASQWKQAAEHYEVVLRVNPGNVAALNNLAWSLNEIKDPRALAVAEDAYAKAPQSPAVVDTLGMIVLAKGDTERAVKLLKRAAEMAPKSADIRMHYAQSLIKAGDKAAARAELNAIVKDLPDAPQLSAVRDLAARL